MFNGLKLVDVKDFRAVGANKIFGMLYDQYLGQITCEGFIKEAKELSSYLQEYVRNIYECIDNEIPVLMYLDILDANNMEDINIDDLTKEEALKQVKEAIHIFYSE